MIAGGGTGGHLFPGIAIAQELLNRNNVEILFVCTRKPMTINALKRYNLPVRTIEAAGIKGAGLFGTLRALSLLPAAVYQSLCILRGFRPQLIVGVGGYVSGPVIVAARLLGLKTAIQEQNSVPGLTNRLLGRLVDKIFIAYPESKDFFPGEKTLLSGNPIREELLRSTGKEEERFTILILGGSQGAHRLNELMTSALNHLSEWRDKLSFIHQTGEKDAPWVQAAYEREGFEARVSSFIDDMSRAYQQADLVFCRAGAGTLAELTALGKPALLVPYPFAANNHQEGNARSLEKSGAAKTFVQAELTPEILTGEIIFFYQNRGALEEMAARSLAVGKPRAAASIADACLKMIGEN